MYADIGHITLADALADTDPLFDDLPAGLPADLIARGWKLIERMPGRMFAVSTEWGCTSTKTNIRDVISEAWGLVGFCEYVNRARSEGREVGELMDRD